MTAAARNYFGQWRHLRRMLREAGVLAADVDHERHRVHVEALGRDCSHRDVDAGELRLVLAAFRRRIAMLLWVRRLAGAAGVSADGVSAYLDAIAQRVAGQRFAQLSPGDTAKVYAAVRAQARRVRTRRAIHA